jgi:CDP-ribitol ribitolphosphotransferase
VLASYPALIGRRVVLYAPTFRGRGIGKHAAPGVDAARLRAALPGGDVLVLKTHPNLDPAATATEGYDVVVDPTADINDLLALTDILITDYSSSVVEFALLQRPIILLVGDLAEYEVDPGLYLDYRTEMIGTQVIDTDGIVDAITTGRFDLSGYDAFIERQLGLSRGGASDRFVAHFLDERGPPEQRGVTLPRDVRHE